MSDDDSARCGVQAAGTHSAPGRTRLGKWEWRDIRRARKLGADGELHAVELHGVRLTFRFQKAHSGPAQDKAMPRTKQEGHRRLAGAQQLRSGRPPPHHGRRTSSGRDRARQGKEAYVHSTMEQAQVLARTPVRRATQPLERPQVLARRLRRAPRDAHRAGRTPGNAGVPKG